MKQKTADMLKESLCKELDKIAEKRSMTASDLEVTHKLTDTLKNISKIEMLEEGEMDEGYSNAPYRSSYDRGSSYARRGSHYVNGHYSMDDGNRYSGRRYDMNDGYAMRRGYSRADAKDEMMSALGGMMEDASEEERQILEDAMRNLRKV